MLFHHIELLKNEASPVILSVFLVIHRNPKQKEFLNSLGWFVISKSKDVSQYYREKIYKTHVGVESCTASWDFFNLLLKTRPLGFSN